MIEVVVTDDATERLAAEDAILLLVDLLEDRALIPRRSLELLESFMNFLLGDIHDLYLEHLVGFGLVAEILEPSPRAFELLEIRVVENLIQLIGQLVVDRRDVRLDRVNHI